VPCPAMNIKGGGVRSLQSWHVPLRMIADQLLHVSEVAISGGEEFGFARVRLEDSRRIDEIEAILLIVERRKGERGGRSFDHGGFNALLHALRPRHLAEAPASEVFHRLIDFLATVHDEGNAADDGFIDWLSGQHQHRRIRVG
jgi:hypothetical protein